MIDGRAIEIKRFWTERFGRITKKTDNRSDIPQQNRVFPSPQTSNSSVIQYYYQ